jgi:hypothetical protein
MWALVGKFLDPLTMRHGSEQPFPDGQRTSGGASSVGKIVVGRPDCRLDMPIVTSAGMSIPSTSLRG